MSVPTDQRCLAGLEAARPLVDALPSLVSAFDLESRFLFANRAFERFYGVSRQELAGRTRSALPNMQPGDAAAERLSDLAIIEFGETRTCEVVVQNGHGTRLLSQTKFPLYDAARNLCGIAEVGTELPQNGSQAGGTFGEVLRRLARAVEFRDKATADHQRRMGSYCWIVAQQLGLPEARCDLLRAAAPLHDVGKVAVPDHILLKPGPLTHDERLQMERHAQVGYDLLEGTGTPVLDLAATIALTHHEHHDGTGYPRRLRGEEIPLEGRIAAIADVYDALTSDRPYRPALRSDDAIGLIAQERGTQFDPRVVDAFLAAPHEIETVRLEGGTGREVAA